jgi:hypothetical protein
MQEKHILFSETPDVYLLTNGSFFTHFVGCYKAHYVLRPSFYYYYGAQKPRIGSASLEQ